MASILQLRGAATGSIPGPINDLATPTLTGTSVTTNFSVPTGTVTGYQYTLDGGSTTNSLSGPGGSITGMVTGIDKNAQVRAMNGGVPGPWSNTALASPGLDVRILFDTTANNLDGHGTGGSYEVTPSNCFCDSGITCTSNLVVGAGFPSLGERTKGIQVIQNIWSDLRQLVDSIGRVNVCYGVGRFKNYSNGHFSANSNAGGNSASWLGQDTLYSSYADYQAQIAALTNATQKSFWPGGGTVPDPGAFPAVTNWAISKNLAAIWNNDTTNTAQWFMCTNSAYTWSYSTNPSVNDNGGVMYNYSAWHETLQPFGISINATGTFGWSIFMMLAYSANGTHWNQTSNNNPYISLDNGASSLGFIQQPSDGFDTGSYKASVTGALSAAVINIGQTGLPASPVQMPNGGRLLPLQINDMKTLCAAFPPTPALKTMAGL